jgi:hypothetical protein
MIGDSSLASLRRSFAGQFEPDGDGFLYRKGMKGPPIRVSAVEMASFEATYLRQVRYAMWSIVPLTLGLVGLLVWLNPDTESVAANVALYAGVIAILTPPIVLMYRARSAPARALADRRPEGPERSKAEFRRVKLATISYGQLAFAALAGCALVWKQSFRVDVFHGWGELWLAFGAGIIVLAAVQALRKWLSERAQAG